MKRMLFLLLLMPAVLYAENWPIDEIAFSGTLGGDLRRGFITGALFESAVSEIRPLQEGEVIFYADNTNVPFLNTNNVLVVEHENGFRSYYHNIDFQEDIPKRTYLPENTLLGSSSTALMQILDLQTLQYVNPLKILSILEDKDPPTIMEVLLIDQQNAVILKEGQTIPPGDYLLYIKSAESWLGQSGTVQLPYAIKAVYQGSVIADLQFDTLVFEKGEIYVEGRDRYSWAELYSREGYLCLGNISLSSGQGSLDLTVEDYSQNSASRLYRFRIR